MNSHVPPINSTNPPSLTLVSHALCPYVQRAVIVALEKAIAFERIVIDLANKPDWFVQLSPTGRVPMLIVGEELLFESAAIAEFLDEISHGGMLPEGAVSRARHRAWIEFASGTLAEIGGLYAAKSADAFDDRVLALMARFARVEYEVVGPWFGGEAFGLVDAAFAPVFRYLDAFESHAGLSLLAATPRIASWRKRLAGRASVRDAVDADYPERLRKFLVDRNAHLSNLMAEVAAARAKLAA